MKIGVLLINIGSPEAPTAKALRPYLRKFLSDPRVLDMPAFPRWLLLHGYILRFRPRRSAHAYAQIWTPEGSPLLAHTRDFATKLQKHLGDGYHVEYAMACGQPFIPDVVEKMLREPLRELRILPLYPQYAPATTGGNLEAVLKALAPLDNIPPLRTFNSFFDHPAYLDAMTKVNGPRLEALKPDHVLFSYHGLPERQIRKAETTAGHCLSKENCCAEYGPRNALCYRAQCFQTTRLLAHRMNLEPEQYSISFQSRLGRVPWIQPYTEDTLVALAKKGVKRLAVFTPSFVADCLETLEEIGIRGAEVFRKAGGESLELLPALNGSDVWARAAADIVR